MKFKKTLILIMLVSLTASSALADFACSSDVKYRWKKADKDETTVFWAVLEKRGVDEKSAKTGLSEAANREQARALAHCQREHQNTSGCIASRLDAALAILSRLSFSARNKLEESIVEDCTIQQGVCVAVDVSQPVCTDLAPPVVEEETSKAAGKKGKAK